MNNHHFPDGVMLGKYIGDTIIISDDAYTIIEILSEKFQPNVNEPWGVFEAISETADETIILKIRYQLDNGYMSPSERQSIDRWTRENFDDEYNALYSCQELETIPRVFTRDELVQEPFDLFPSGYLRVIVVISEPSESEMLSVRRYCE